MVLPLFFYNFLVAKALFLKSKWKHYWHRLKLQSCSLKTTPLQKNLLVLIATDYKDISDIIFTMRDFHFFFFLFLLAFPVSPGSLNQSKHRNKLLVYDDSNSSSPQKIPDQPGNRNCLSIKKKSNRFQAESCTPALITPVSCQRIHSKHEFLK